MIPEGKSAAEGLEHDMRVTFNADELNGFYRGLEPIDLDELWRILDGEDDDS
ncbi:MAG: hypothetical protein AAF654_01345 [Myxococcota bacterium]